MLNRLDDYPIHQTPEPIAQPATSERNLYDRTWFNGYAADGSYFFAVTMAIYPHRGILDGALSVVTPGGEQHCVFASRRAPVERTETNVGPLRLEVLEPMRRTRIVLEENESGLACDLVFSARTAAIQEGRQTLWNGARRIMDATRFDQFGRWHGVISTPDGEIRVDKAVCHGIKDRSWGHRQVGEPETGGAPAAAPSSFFLWTPIAWDDHITHAIFFDNERGEPLINEGVTAPLYPSEAAIPAVQDGRDRRLAHVAHRLAYHPGTRLARRAEIDLMAHDGAVRTLRLEPLLKFQMKGLGYVHPKWGHGRWQGELAVGCESFDPAALHPLETPNLHTQLLIRAYDGDQTGLGVLEQFCRGPYAPAGFTDLLDGAKG